MQSRKLFFISKDHFHKLNVSWIWTFPARAWLPSSFICLILQWPLNGCPCYIYCPHCHQGYLARKCIWSCHFLVEKPFLKHGHFLLSRSLALILLQALYFSYSMQTWLSSPNKCLISASKCMTVSLKMYVFSLLLSYKLLIIFQFFYLQRNPFYACQHFPLTHPDNSETSIGSGTLSFWVPVPHYINI